MKPRRILVVDDEEDIRRSLSGVLEDEGYDVEEADSAEKGIQLLGQEDFFMVITDARMGGISGYEFLEKAKQQWPQVPVLMITAEARKEDIVLAAQSGASGYIVKPFTKATLEEKVTKILQKHSMAA